MDKFGPWLFSCSSYHILTDFIIIYYYFISVEIIKTLHRSSLSETQHQHLTFHCSRFILAGCDALTYIPSSKISFSKHEPQRWSLESRTLRDRTKSWMSHLVLFDLWPRQSAEGGLQRPRLAPSKVMFSHLLSDHMELCPRTPFTESLQVWAETKTFSLK